MIAFRRSLARDIIATPIKQARIGRRVAGARKGR
jgi:hypothetical protein